MIHHGRTLRNAGVFAILLLSVWLFVPGHAAGQEGEEEDKPIPANKPVPNMTVFQARKAVLNALQQVSTKPYQDFLFRIPANYTAPPRDIKLARTQLSYYAPFRHRPEAVLLDLSTVGYVTIDSYRGRFYYLRVDGKRIYRQPQLKALSLLQFENQGDAQALADGINRLSHEARTKGSVDEFAEFRKLAHLWRELDPKPPLPEEARRRKVLAENAVQENNPEAAMQHYQAGLEVEPCWPDGQFNAAVLAADAQDYDAAVHHMKAYLELMPDAPDSAEVRDKVIIWEDKLQQAGGSSTPSAGDSGNTRRRGLEKKK